MTYLVWAPDGKRTVEMEGKIHPDALRDDLLISPVHGISSILEIGRLMGSDGDAVALLTRRTATATLR